MPWSQNTFFYNFSTVREGEKINQGFLTKKKVL